MVSTNLRPPVEVTLVNGNGRTIGRGQIPQLVQETPKAKALALKQFIADVQTHHKSREKECPAGINPCEIGRLVRIVPNAHLPTQVILLGRLDTSKGVCGLEDNNCVTHWLDTSDKQGAPDPSALGTLTSAGFTLGVVSRDPKLFWPSIANYPAQPERNARPQQVQIAAIPPKAPRPRVEPINESKSPPAAIKPMPAPASPIQMAIAPKPEVPTTPKASSTPTSSPELPSATLRNFDRAGTPQTFDKMEIKPLTDRSNRWSAADQLTFSKAIPLGEIVTRFSDTNILATLPRDFVGIFFTEPSDEEVVTVYVNAAENRSHWFPGTDLSVGHYCWRSALPGYREVFECRGLEKEHSKEGVILIARKRNGGSGNTPMSLQLIARLDGKDASRVMTIRPNESPVVPVASLFDR